MGYPQLLMAIDYSLDRAKEIAIASPRNSTALEPFLKALFQPFNPNKVVAVGDKEELPLLKRKTQNNGIPTVYVCEKNICKLPTTDPKKAAKLALEKKPYKL